MRVSTEQRLVGPLVSDNYVYVGTIQGKILACDLNTGDQEWVESRGAE